MKKGAKLFDLAGRRALTTGSSQGIGPALARGLAEAGAAVVMNGRDAAKLDYAGAALAADPAFSAWLGKRTPAGRRGRFEKLVGACVFLTSHAATFVNGDTPLVDGGVTAPP